MDYMTLKEASEKWGVTPRRINYLCASGRIPGAVKMLRSGSYQRMHKNRRIKDIKRINLHNRYTFPLYN